MTSAPVEDFTINNNSNNIDSGLSDTNPVHALADPTSAVDSSTNPQTRRVASTDPSPSSTGIGATATDSPQTIKNRVSKRSLRRRTSATSSKRSHNTGGLMSEKAPRPMSSAAAQASQPRAKKKSKFLTFLCCGQPDETGEPGQELGEAPRQTAAPSNPTGQTQSTTKLANTTAPEQAQDQRGQEVFASSVLDEKATPGNSFNELNKTAEDNDNPMPGLSAVAGEQSASGAAAVISQPISSGPGDMSATNLSEGGLLPLDTNAGLSSNNPNVVVQAPTPVALGSDEQLISDRTPEQQARDTDIEMTDVGPSLPLSSHDVAGVSEEEARAVVAHNESPTQVDLPPPPPLEERQAQIAHETSTSQEVGVAGNAEAQKWLLPPLRPELKGRKCLVLDLDETLVHSSFKVRHMHTTTFTR